MRKMLKTTNKGRKIYIKKKVVFAANGRLSKVPVAGNEAYLFSFLQPGPGPENITLHM